MNQFEIIKGSRKVIVTSQDGNVDARLYVGNGEIATPTAWSGKTEKGARKWAGKVLAVYDADILMALEESTAALKDFATLMAEQSAIHGIIADNKKILARYKKEEL